MATKTISRTAIVRLPFHRYYRELSYVVDAAGHAIYQGDIDLGPVKELQALSEVNRRKFRKNRLPNGLVKLQPNTRFTAIWQEKLKQPEPPVFTKSSIQLDPDRKWTAGVVPFVIDSSSFTTENVLPSLQECMDFLEERTIVSFVPRTNHPDYVLFTNCVDCSFTGSSPVGKQSGRQFIRLKDGTVGEGFATKGAIVHEIMHTLGFYHTQSRPDRDKWICIFPDNIEEAFQDNFDIHDSEEYAGVHGPYNVNSFMHYSSCTFSVGDCNPAYPDVPTMLARNSDGSCDPNHIGGNSQLFQFPDSDIAAINYLYGLPSGQLGVEVPVDQPRTLTANIIQLTTLVGPEENGLGCNNLMDYYGTIELGPLADIGADPYAFAHSQTFTYTKVEGNDIWPGWTATIALRPGERFGLIRITVWDDDKAGPAGIGACGGADDNVDISPFENMRQLDLVVDTETNEVHLSRTIATLPPGMPPYPANLVYSSTLNGKIGSTFNTIPISGNTVGENHAARIRVRVGLE